MSELTINTNLLLHNQRVMSELAAKRGVGITVVTKGLVGDKALAELLVRHGAKSIAEAHIQNLIKFQGIPAEKWLIRSPLISEADDVVRYADVSLVTEMIVLKHLSAAAARQGRVHKTVVMLELGELREGCMPDELLPLCEACLSLPGLALHGIGANLSCINEIVPDDLNMGALANAAETVEKSLGVKLPLVSGGSSSSVKMLEEGRLPERVNHLRIGEAILLGNIVCYDMPYEGARTDAFTLCAEIIEVKEKPSLPWGERAHAQSETAHGAAAIDRGIRKRALIAVGKQDIHSKYLVPIDPGLEILGDTSDCLIADVTDCSSAYKPGDAVYFRLKYNGLVSAMASDYIEKNII